MTQYPQVPADQNQAKRPVIFGEVLFDCFADQRVLGGAPFNVAWNLKGLGLDPHFVSAVGDDRDGDTVRSRMEGWGMDLSGLQTKRALRTGVVNVLLKDDEPSYDICESVAYDEIEPSFSDAILKTAALFYHGSLAFRSATNQKSILQASRELRCPRFLDINIRQPHFRRDWLETLLPDLDHLKLNIGELQQLCDIDETVEKFDPIMLCRHGACMLRDRYKIDQFWITLGSSGAVWVGADDRWCFEPATPVEKLVDTVGAGDAFAAVIIEGIVLGRTPSQALHRGNQLAAKVCGIRGATSDDKSFYRASAFDDFDRSGPTTNSPPQPSRLDT